MTASELQNHPIVARLSALQTSLGLKDIPFAKQLRLGIHGANWGKILAGTYDGSFSKALVKLQVALEAYDNPGSGETEEGIVILRHVREAIDAMTVARAAEDEHRLVVLAGLRGSGKSRAMSLVAHKFPGHEMEALPSWSGGYLNFLNKFAAGVGVQKHTENATWTLTQTWCYKNCGGCRTTCQVWVSYCRQSSGTVRQGR